MRSLIVPLAVFIVGVFFISCKEEEPISKVKSIFPVESGNSWTYIDSFISEGCWLFDTSVLNVGEKRTINGVTGYLFTGGSHANPYQCVEMAVNDEDGNFIYLGGFSSIDTLILSSMMLKNNAMLNEKWTYYQVECSPDYGLFHINDTVEITCIQKDTIINTIKGDFVCDVYTYDFNAGGDLRTVKDYVSLGVGIVKEVASEYGREIRRRILIDYKVK
jgi:hypothetical protein